MDNLRKVFEIIELVKDLTNSFLNLSFNSSDRLFSIIKSFSVNSIDYKGLGRVFILFTPKCYIGKEIETVKKIILEIDKFEYNYLPENFIVNINKENINNIQELVYNGKFEIDCSLLIKKCYEKGILILIDSRSECEGF